MIEEAVISYLNANLTVPAYAEWPEIVPEKFCMVALTSGGMHNFIWSGLVTIQAYADTKYEASQLRKQVINTMSSINQMGDFSHCTLNNDSDTGYISEKKYCYHAVFDVVYLGD